MESGKTNHIWQPLLFAFVLIFGMWFGYKLAITSLPHRASSLSTVNTHLDDLIKLISDKYVDTIDEKELYKSGIEGILKQLDPHTVYIPADQLTRTNEELEGSFFGIGIEFYIANDSVTISGVIPGGPSEKKDILPGDKIIKINDSLIAGKKLEDEDIIRRIRGLKNTNVSLTLMRVDNSTHKVEIARGNVPLKSVPAYFKINDETGYIKIDMFSETTYDEFKEALTNLTKQHIKKLIIDVRDNPGGYMDAVASVADELVAGEHVIVTTKGKQKTDSLVTHVDGLFESGKLCILIDENSASASEILAGSMQDLDRGILVGRRTYGKGLVQEQFELPDMSAIRITTARYYLPSGRCIQKSYADGKEKYKQDILERYKKGQLQLEDTSHTIAKQYYTSKHKVVYCDEGVSPDVFVPLDTTYIKQLDDFYLNHLSEEFAFRYFYFHKNEFMVFKTLETFSKEFLVNVTMKQEMKRYIIQHNIAPSVLDSQKVFTEITMALKAQFGKLLFGNNGRYKALYEQDEFIAKALQAMQ